MNGKTIAVIAVLAGLALIPVTLTFLCSGENEDAVEPVAPARTAGGGSAGAGPERTAHCL